MKLPILTKASLFLLALVVAGYAVAQIDVSGNNNESATTRPLETLLGANKRAAMNEPDKTSWLLFAYVAAPAPNDHGNHAVFESWATDGDTFRRDPQWPGQVGSLHPHTAVLQSNRSLLTSSATSASAAESLPDLEEVHRNRSTFDYIVTNQLYTQEGLAAAFASGKPIVFPLDSVEVKEDWVPADRAGITSDRYHVSLGVDGRRYALVSMHITSKLIPNWTWATFEHEDNPGRCDYIGCRDGFGATMPWVAPLSTTGARYGTCQKSSALLSIFAKAGLDRAWQHYCLKGSQVDFTDSTGRPVHLGNTIPEKGMVNTASCMTCHARAAFDREGIKSSEDGSLVVTAPTAVCPTGSPCSPNGAPDPAWFWQQDQPLAVQTDFVWAIPYCAVPKGKITGPCI